MKKLIPLVAIILFACSIWNCERSGSNVKIEGKLKIPTQTDVWLGNLGVESLIPIDSTVTDEQGEFMLSISTGESSLCLLKVGPKTIYLVVKPGEKIEIEIDNSIEVVSYYVEGSMDSRLLQELVTAQERVLNQITEISLQYEKSKLNPESFVNKKAELDSMYNKLLRDQKTYSEELIYKNPKSLTCIFALYQNFGKTSQPLFDKFEDFHVFNFVDSSLALLYPKTPAVQALNSDVIEVREQLKYKNYSDKLTEPGRKAPEFEIETIDNKIIKLSDYSGSPVVYFFFAVWNSSSVDEAKILNEIYQRYRYRGLKIIGVSFDSSEEKLRAFIDNNDIVYPIVCDYNYWDSKYVSQFGVRKVPDLILLSPNHIIHQRNINSSELKLTLGEWNKNKVF